MPELRRRNPHPVAMIDERETPAHPRRRFTVGY
jgi:putative NADH-flavin reductase